MSQIRKAFFGAAAVMLTVGAVEFASGSNTLDRWHATSSESNQQASRVNRAGKADRLVNRVNRAGKADRLADHKPAAVPTGAVLLRLKNLANTSVFLRVPRTEPHPTKRPTLLQNESVKPTLACEPMVSALTEVAKVLQPGRCVT